MLYNAKEIDHRKRYQLINGFVSPRPIAWIASTNTEGVINLAPHSWYTTVSVSPAMIGFTSGSAKDTYRNIKQTKEFVVNVVTEELTERMNLTAVNFPPEVSEMDEIGFEKLPSTQVSVPRVKESPMQLECRLVDIHQYGDIPSYFIVGEVVVFHVSEAVMDEQEQIDPHLVKAVGEGSYGGHFYTKTTETFERPRMNVEEYHEQFGKK